MASVTRVMPLQDGPLSRRPGAADGSPPACRAPSAVHRAAGVGAASLATWQSVVKRAVDLVVATILLLLTLPVVLVAVLAVKLQDGGPVLFRQERVGRDGKRFTLYKLRSMVPDAEAQLARLRPRNDRDGPLFKLDDDPRVTRVGRVLRVTSVDELPQLVSVLRGTMSMVGPRPALPEEVAQFDERHLRRLRVPPGITGLWQVEAGDDTSFASYRRLDLAYVERWSLRLDFVILVNTVTVLLRRSVQSLRRDHPDVPERAVVLD